MNDDAYWDILRKSGIPEGSGDIEDYEEAKRWAGTVCEDAKEYERLIQVAAMYCKV